MNIPNMISVFRILLVPIYLLVFFSNLENRFILAGLIFILAGISDVLDGNIARKYNLTTKLGALLDPVADKLMLFAVLISYTVEKIIPIWILLALGAKEIVLVIGASILYLFKGNQVLPSNKYGKVATFSFYVATLSVVFKLPGKLSQWLFIFTVALNILAFINYLKIYMVKRENA